VSSWFADASVLLARENGDDEQHDAACRLLSGQATLLTLDIAFYEVSNVAARAWHDSEAAHRLRGLVDALAEGGGLVRVEKRLSATRLGLPSARALRCTTPPTSPGPWPPACVW